MSVSTTTTVTMTKYNINYSINKLANVSAFVSIVIDDTVNCVK